MRHFLPITQLANCDVCGTELAPAPADGGYVTRTAVKYDGNDRLFFYCSNRHLNEDADRSAALAESESHYHDRLFAGMINGALDEVEGDRQWLRITRNTAVTRILAAMEEGIDVEPLVRFTQSRGRHTLAKLTLAEAQAEVDWEGTRGVVLDQFITRVTMPELDPRHASRAPYVSPVRRSSQAAAAKLDADLATWDAAVPVTPSDRYTTHASEADINAALSYGAFASDRSRAKENVALALNERATRHPDIDGPAADLVERFDLMEADCPASYSHGIQKITDVISFTGFAGGTSMLFKLACGHGIIDDSADEEAAR
jgi:hypothetical protein